MAYYAEKDFFADDRLIELVTDILNGNLTLEWFEVETARLQAKPADPARGLTYQDCNLGPYGYDAIPELVRNRNSMASRGSVLVPKLPDLGYTINRKSDVWSDNVCALYEEAKSRRWAPAVDVPWSELHADTATRCAEAAVAQLCTLLEEVALVAAGGARPLGVRHQPGVPRAEELPLRADVRRGAARRGLSQASADQRTRAGRCQRVGRAGAEGAAVGGDVSRGVAGDERAPRQLRARHVPRAGGAGAHASRPPSRDPLDAGRRALGGVRRRTPALPSDAPAGARGRAERVPRSHRAHGRRDRRQHRVARAAHRPRGRLARPPGPGARQRVCPHAGSRARSPTTSSAVAPLASAIAAPGAGSPRSRLAWQRRSDRSWRPFPFPSASSAPASTGSAT